MGKIKGWTRSKSGATIWYSNRSSIDIGNAIDKNINYTDKFVLNIIRDNVLVKNLKFPNEKEAINYAIKYMRLHKNG